MLLDLKKCCPTHVFFFVKDIFFRECSIKTSSHWGDSTGHWYFEEVLSNYGHCQMFEFLLSKYTINAVSMQLIILQLLRATEGTIWPKLTLLNLNSPNVCNVQGYPILSHSMFVFSPSNATDVFNLLWCKCSLGLSKHKSEDIFKIGQTVWP